MYKLIEADKEAVLDNGTIFTPVATLADEYGGRCQISVDDHCYILSLKQADGRYKTTPYIFREAFDVLGILPPPFTLLKDETSRGDAHCLGHFEVAHQTGEYDWELSCGPYKTYEAAEKARQGYYNKEEIPYMRVVQFFSVGGNRLRNNELNERTIITSSEHDDRLSVTFIKGDMTLRIAAFDELPHKMAADGKNYDRISWEEFRHLLGGMLG